MSALCLELTSRLRTCILQARGRRSSRQLLLAVFSLLSLSTASAQGLFQLDPVRDFDFGVWANAGDLSGSDTTCNSIEGAVLSLGGKGESILTYKVKLTSLEDSKSFFLYKDGDSASASNQQIAVSFTHQDLIGSGGTEVLRPKKNDSRKNRYGLLNCLTTGNNSRLTVDLSAQQLESVENGYYTGNFQMELDSKWGTELMYFSVSVRIQGSSEVRVSRLDDLRLGEYSGSGRIQASERFCVYSANGSYRLSVSSANQNAGGKFYLYSDETGQRIPMDLRFADNIAGPAATTVGQASLSGMGNSQSKDCGGTDNATLTLALEESDLAASKSGFYSDTLVVLVQPE